MSYVVHIWQHPVQWRYPRRFDTTLAMLDALRPRRPGRNPVLEEFARRLTARHPCITSPESDDLDESELAWSDGPLDGRTDAAVYAIGLNSARLDEVLPFVRATARGLGLSLYDDQAGRFWLANGTELASHGDPPWHRFPPAYIEVGRTLPEKDALLDRVLDVAGATLSALGFAVAERDPRGDHDRSWTAVTLRRDCPLGWQVMRLNAVDLRPERVKLSATVTAWVTEISRWRLDVHHAGHVPADARPLSNLEMLSSAWMNDIAGLWETADGGAFVLRSPDDVDRMVKVFEAQLRARLKPLLAGFDSLPALVDLLAPGPIEWSPFIYSPAYVTDALVAAYLARSPRLPELIREAEQKARPLDPKGSGLRAAMSDWDAAMIRHMHACIARMRSAPLPPR